MDINNYIYSQCQNPVKINVYDGIENAYIEKSVPCGKCYHCKITRINEWVTRMVAESNYNRFVYFGTLTYGSKKPTLYHEETLSHWTTFNKTNTLAYTPLVLRKDHVQKFLKRLRKNTGIKFQVAYCGEYGSTYSRPHYHYIIWSNEPISQLQIYKAWTAPSLADPTKRIVLGKVEHRDIKNEAYLNPQDPDNTHVFKYVCKYIQKFDFDFEQLTNIKDHYKTYEKEFNKNFIYSQSTGKYYYIGERFDKYLIEKGIHDFYDYKKAFCPFFHCSKRPALGYKYLQDHIGEFQKANFKLFGLPKEYIFPLYFVRKTKESLCPFKAKSETNDNLTSYSRLPKMAALIDYIKDAKRIAEQSNQIVQLFKRINNDFCLESFDRIQDLERINDTRDTQLVPINHYMITKKYMSFVDVSKHVAYDFNGNSYTLYNTTTKEYIGEASLSDVKHLILYYYETLKNAILCPLMAKSKVSADKKEALINDYGGIEKFEEAKKNCLISFMNNVNKKQKIYKQTKTFE